MKVLIDLINTIGPAGYETLVLQKIKKAIKPYVDTITTDSFGNLICHKKGKGEKVMIAAHADEVGLMVKKIDATGFIRITPVGGIEPISLVGQGAIILNRKNKEACKGIITFAKLHDAKDVTEVPKMDDLYIDTGISKKELEKKDIQTGCYIIPLHHTQFLGNENILMGKALDDRVGCYILIETARLLKKMRSKQDIYYVFTVQEEVGLYGAKTATWNIKPDWGIAIETTLCADSDGEHYLGKGPFLSMKDTDMISNRCLDDWIQDISKKHKIPLQLEINEFGTTDAKNMMLSRGGIPSTTLSVPVRNIHSTVGVCHKKDISSTIEILTSLLKNPPKVCVH